MSKTTKQMITLGVAVLLLGGLLTVYFGLEARREREAAAAAAEAAEAEEPIFHLIRLVDQSEASLKRATFTTDEYSFTIEAVENEEGRITWVYADDWDVILEQPDARNMMRDVFLLSATDLVLEEVDDPSEYGIGRLVVTGYFRDGSQEIIRLGMMTPDHNRFYVMVDGNPALYLINAVSGNRLIQHVSELVARSVPFMEGHLLTRLYVRERGRNALEFGWDGTEEELEDTLNQFGGAWLTMFSPFPGRELTISNFERIALEDFQGFRPGKLIEMFPDDLGQFGLDDPILEFVMEDVLGASFHLIFGDDHDDEHLYMMFEDRPHVFIVNRRYIRGLLGLNPFNFIERFVALMNIVDVESITIQSVDRGNYEIVINNFQDENERDQIAPIVNGQEVQDNAFRRFYQTLIGVIYDHDIGVQEDLGPPVITVTYYLLDESKPPTVVEFFSYDPNFYAVRQYPYPAQFVTSRLAVEIVFDSMEGLLAGEFDR